jgi:hypothetical protein
MGAPGVHLGGQQVNKNINSSAKRAASGCPFYTRVAKIIVHTLTPHPSLYWGVVACLGLLVDGGGGVTQQENFSGNCQ